MGEIPLDEPSSPSRIRRPADAVRFLLALGALGLVLLFVIIARGTTSGLESDIVQGTAQTPHVLLTLANLVSSFGVLVVPVAFGVARLLQRDGLRIAVGVLAAVVALGVSLALDEWMIASGAPLLTDYLAWPRAEDDVFPGPAHTDLTPVIAYLTAARLGGRPRWQLAIWGVIALDALASLAAGNITPFTLGTTYLIGRAIGYGTLYVAGSPNTRPSGQAVVAVLGRMGLTPVSGRRVPGGPEEARRYRLAMASGPALDVTVLDRDQQVVGLLYRLWRRVRLRAAIPRRTLGSLRRSLEQESLMAYAVAAAGVRTPRLVATCEIGTEAAALVYEHVSGRPLDAVPDEDINDEVLADIWRQLRALQAQRLAHRRLEARSVLLDDAGRAHLVELRAGEIAASDLVLRIDLAQLLTSLALRVGPVRAVRSAATVLGPDALARALPLLQSVALNRSTRTALRKHKDMLIRVREQVLAQRPQVEVEPVRLERIRLRTLVSIIAGTAGAYFVLSQLSHVDLSGIVTRADWRWTAVALVAAAVSYLAAALMLLGFVPERLPVGRTVLVQLAGSFVKLMAPAAVTGVAVNTRYLQRSGVPPGQAVASVGASQLTGMVFHALLLLVFGFVSGSRSAPHLAPSRSTVIAVLTLAVLASLIAAISPLRRIVVARTRSLFSGVLPRLLDVLQSPKKIATGFGGTLLLTIMFVLCLDASIRAFGGSLSIVVVAVVFLTGNALGSAAPTPGGLGAVEGALTLGLTISGLPAETATSAVLLFRLLTFWLPVPPGWAAFTYLQRKEAL